MENVKSHIKFWLNRLLPYKKLERARQENSRLLSLSVALSDIHVANTQVLPDRISLLQALPRNGVVAEVGVAEGGFSEKILQVNCPKKLYLIDAWGMVNHPNYSEGGFHKVQEKFSTDISAGKVEIHRGISWEMLAELADESLDWVYIDASHDYDSVKKDLEAANRKVKKGGLIAGHDYVRWGRFGHRFGVLEAVNEFILSHHYELAYITLENNLNWSYAIKKNVDSVDK